MSAVLLVQQLSVKVGLTRVLVPSFADEPEAAPRPAYCTARVSGVSPRPSSSHHSREHRSVGYRSSAGSCVFVEAARFQWHEIGKESGHAAGVIGSERGQVVLVTLWIC